MREILFRGKRIDNGEWAYGTPALIDCEWHIIPHNPMHVPMYIEVTPETIGQYTGLTDKNGKKIFEGDIIECWSQGVKARGDVRQRIDGLWIIYPAFQRDLFWGLCPNDYGATTVEVIGNIHDNPELLNN